MISKAVADDWATHLARMIHASAPLRTLETEDAGWVWIGRLGMGAAGCCRSIGLGALPCVKSPTSSLNVPEVIGGGRT
jgi:hypothetical protein